MPFRARRTIIAPSVVYTTPATALAMFGFRVPGSEVAPRDKREDGAREGDQRRRDPKRRRTHVDPFRRHPHRHHHHPPAAPGPALATNLGSTPGGGPTVSHLLKAGRVRGRKRGRRSAVPFSH